MKKIFTLMLFLLLSCGAEKSDIEPTIQEKAPFTLDLVENAELRYFNFTRFNPDADRTLTEDEHRDSARISIANDGIYLEYYWRKAKEWHEMYTFDLRMKGGQVVYVADPNQELSFTRITNDGDRVELILDAINDNLTYTIRYTK